MSGRGTSVTVPMHCDRLTVDAPVIASRLRGHTLSVTPLRPEDSSGSTSPTAPPRSTQQPRRCCTPTTARIRLCTGAGREASWEEAMAAKAGAVAAALSAESARHWRSRPAEALRRR
jgi:hypothetical protein